MVEAAERPGAKIQTGVCTTDDAFCSPDDLAQKNLLRRAGVVAAERSNTAQHGTNPNFLRGEGSLIRLCLDGS